MLIEINKPSAISAFVFPSPSNRNISPSRLDSWLACNIPGNQNSLPENSSRLTPDYLQGYNSWCMPFPGYKKIPKDYCRHFGGPAPGYQHEYEVWIYALDTVLDLEEGFWYNQLRRKMKGHILASASLCGYYGT